VDDSGLKTIWDAVYRKLQSDLGDPVVNSWISPLSVDRFDSSILYLRAPSLFLRDWVVNNYAEKIADCCKRENSEIKAIDIFVSSSLVDGKKKAPTTKATSGKSKTDDALNLSIPLDPKLTFENFVVGKPNELAYAAALRVAESGVVAFNPLFLYGAVGLGKTHLMHSIAWSIKARDPNRNIAYMSAEKFMYHFIKSVRYKDTMAFKEQFRSVDVLMIDDIQFICGKDSTQEEFFHTFNELVDNNRQVIVSADKSPSDLDGMEERLKSRLGWGLVADIHPTTYELRLGILQAKATVSSVKIPDKVLEFVAHKITSNIRELEGALNRIIASAVFVGREVTIESAREVLSDLLRTNGRKVTIEEIQKKVAAHYSVKLNDMFSPKRTRQISMPRQIAMYLAKKLTTLSLPEIGKNFGGRDHTTVIHAVKKIEEAIGESPGVSEDIMLLTNILNR
jgi:chromosomal replication initiator protein